MAKKQVKPAAPPPTVLPLVFDFPVRTKYIILAVIGLIFYGNTLFNGYALDDNGVILGNEYVQKGVSGIYKIMTNDAYSSYLQQLHSSQNFVGGRYRPLSIVVFAVEQSLFGDSAGIRHFVNILFFISTICAIYYFLSNFLLKKLARGEDCAFLAAVLFAIHPLHTEVVANIKSFDEILSFFFILLTFICSLEYIKQAKPKFLYMAMGSFFLSMLSKEYALMLVVLPFFRHFVSIVAFACCLWAMFYFLDKFLFKKIPWGHDMAFIATFLFAIHPLHTEVVANIKSLDEILSILFILLTFIFSLNYLKNKQVKDLAIGVVSYFLALLSKEYAVTLIFFIPLLFYLLEDAKVIPALKASIPYYGIFAVYIFLRYKAVGFHSPPPSSNVLTNPYYFATHLQKIATEWFVLGKYLGLLFWPYPLSADYSYYQIKYHSLTDITVLLSILVYLAITAWGVILLLRKSILSFAVFFFLFNIILISNFVTDIGATMGERLAFHSSFGLVIILAYYVVRLISRGNSDTTTVPIPNKKNILIGAMSLIGVVCLGETVVRNAQWKDDTSLFIHDVSVVPDSFLANSNAGGGYLKLAERKENTIPEAQAYLDSVRKYSLRALKFFPKLDAAYNKLGGVCLHLGQLDSAEYYWDLTEKYHPNYIPLRSNYVLLSHMFFQRGLELGKTGQPQQAVIYMRKALLHDSTNANIWYNMGGAYFTIQRYDSAKYAWMKTLQYQPDNADAKRGLAAMGVQ